ncbi:hypothetical protein AB8810_19385 [Xanthomonas sp. NCPPB 3005]|uniref:hypothetical protein n=1 Tax=Xanthomonas sp. NCPPB 3005 TaxID=3240913 RepID=UPI00351855A8
MLTPALRRSALRLAQATLAFALLWCSAGTAAAVTIPAIDGGCRAASSASLRPSERVAISAITYCAQGDATRATLAVTVKRKSLQRLQLFTAGYIKGGSVRLLAQQSGQAPIALLPEKSDDEQWQPLYFSVPSGWGPGDITFTLTDDATGGFGWGGLGLGKRRHLAGDASAYAIVALHAVAIAGLLLLPGLLWRSCIGPLPLSLLPVPGIILLALNGLALWILPASAAQWFRAGLAGIYLLFAVALLYRRRIRRDGPGTPRSGDRIFIIAIVLALLQAISIGLNPQGVAQEYGGDGELPGRMVASPPDHVIPYGTAVYLLHRYDGDEKRFEYFGDWSIGSRGPLVPLGINTLLQLFGAAPGDPPSSARVQWPGVDSGVDLARLFGWMLNALPILGALHLMGALNVPAERRHRAALWLALAPLLTINVVFLWPKLLAAYFVMLVVGDVLNRRYSRAGIFAALAWLSHPVGALMLPAIGLLLVAQRRGPGFWRSSAAASSRFLGMLLLVMLPWLYYKWQLGHGDAFMSYVFADGRGIKPALGIGSWLAARVSNLWMTLTPAAFFFSDAMHDWIFGPVQDSLRWTIQYAKSLPGQLGFGAFGFAYAALVRSPPDAALRDLRNCIFGAGLATMLIYWGYSTDGLGRNCLEVLTPFVIVYACATWPVSKAAFATMMSIVALESMWVALSGFLLNPAFRLASVAWDGWFLFGLSAATPLILAFHAWRAPYGAPGPADPTHPATASPMAMTR